MTKTLPVIREQIESYLAFFLPKKTDQSCSIEEVKEALLRYINYTNPYFEYKISTSDLIEALRNKGYIVNEQKRCNISQSDLAKMVLLTYSCPDDSIVRQMSANDSCFISFYVESVRRFVQDESHESISLLVNGEGKVEKVFTYENIRFVFRLKDDILFATTI